MIINKEIVITLSIFVLFSTAKLYLHTFEVAQNNIVEIITATNTIALFILQSQLQQLLYRLSEFFLTLQYLLL